MGDIFDGMLDDVNTMRDLQLHYSFCDFEDFWGAILMEKAIRADRVDVAYKALTKELAQMVWNHALVSKEKGCR